jgi:hypothetical protein
MTEKILPIVVCALLLSACAERETGTVVAVAKHSSWPCAYGAIPYRVQFPDGRTVEHCGHVRLGERVTVCPSAKWPCKSLPDRDKWRTEDAP